MHPLEFCPLETKGAASNGGASALLIIHDAYIPTPGKIVPPRTFYGGAIISLVLRKERATFLKESVSTKTRSRLHFLHQLRLAALFLYSDV